MTTTLKQAAHKALSSAAFDLTSALVSLAGAEVTHDSPEGDKAHAIRMRGALLVSAVTGKAPQFPIADVSWLVRTVLGGMDLEGFEDAMRTIALSQIEAFEASAGSVTTTASAEQTPTVSPIGYRSAGVTHIGRCRPRPVVACGQSCCSCCHRVHCTPHVRH